MFKKVSVVLTAFVVALLLVMPQAFGVSEDKTDETAWQLSGCWFEIEIENNGYEWLGSYTNWTYEDQINNENPPNDTTPQDVTVRTSCNGYTVNVKATQFDLPTNHGDSGDKDTAIEDFAIKGGSVSDYYYFGSIGDSKEIKNRNNAGTSQLEMYYQYDLDKDDVSGNYAVHLKYTAATK